MNFVLHFAVGMSSGEIMVALYSSLAVIKLAIFSGDNLQALLKDIDYYAVIMKTLNNKNLLPYLLHWQETVSILIDKGQHTGPESNTANLCNGISSLAERVTSCATEVNKSKEAMYINRALQAFWCGYAQRCNHCATQMMKIQSASQYNKLLISFVSMMIGMSLN